MQKLGNFTVHYVENKKNIWLSHNNKIYKYNSAENSVKKIIKINYNKKIQNVFNYSIIQRLFRGEINVIIPMPDTSFLVIFDGRIFKIFDNNIQKVYQISTCRRPLNVCYNQKSNLLIWGDYVDSQTPHETNIFISDDCGFSWKKIYTFEPGKINHIHNIIYDKYRKQYLILTGDKDEESGIWITKDFTKIDPFLIGSQKYRAVSIIIQRDGLIIPSDTPLEKNKIRYYSFKDKKLTDLQILNGSCFFAQKINEHYFVSTVYEPSKVSDYKKTDIWSSENGINWKLIQTWKKDIFPSRLFQYPLLKLPIYQEGYRHNQYYFSTRAVKGGEMTYELNNHDL